MRKRMKEEEMPARTFTARDMELLHDTEHAKDKMLEADPNLER